MDKLMNIIWSIWHRCFFAARKAEREGRELQETLRQDLRDFEATPENERWYNNC